MLLNESSEINKLDNEISSLHQQINQLYRKRLSVMRSQKLAMNNIADEYNLVVNPNSSEAIYRDLVIAWSRHNITIPSFRNFKTRLDKASQINAQLTYQYEGLSDEMRIVLVPPTHILNKILKIDDNSQKQILLDDDIDLNHSVKWRVLTIYGAPHGISLETDIFANRELISDLGVTEYLALIIQDQLLLDEAQWTVLLKGGVQTTAPCVSFANGSYRFMTDEIYSVFNDNTFRPAVEVTV